MDSVLDRLREGQKALAEIRADLPVLERLVRRFFQEQAREGEWVAWCSRGPGGPWALLTAAKFETPEEAAEAAVAEAYQLHPDHGDEVFILVGWLSDGPERARPFRLHLPDKPLGHAAGARKHFFFRRRRGARAKAEWHEEDHPRASDGRFGDKPGEHGSGGTAAKPRKPAAPAAKHVARLERYRNLAVRRRVLHGLRNERVLSDALGALNLPDSEPADVIFLVDAGGEVVTDAEVIKRHLAAREDAVRRLSRLPAEAPGAAPLRELLETHELHFFEVKTLIVQNGAGAVHMSDKARRRKERWEQRYAAPFHTVAFDDRKGRKFSGNRLYYRRGVGSVKLSAMERVADFSDLLGKLGG